MYLFEFMLKAALLLYVSCLLGVTELAANTTSTHYPWFFKKYLTMMTVFPAYFLNFTDVCHWNAQIL